MIYITKPDSQTTVSQDNYPVISYDLKVRLVISAHRMALLLLVLLFGTSVVVACITKNTYDGGDSIYHYLFAHYALQHPENLLNAWAKPLFTLLATLPAQGGFLGMKLFQCVVVAVSSWLTYRIARHFQLPWPALAIVFCYGAPDYFRIQFSGLTEPLFGLILVGAVFLALANRPYWSVSLISWLPFVRSEGVLMLGIWGLYMIWQRQWRTLPLLLLGYAIYSIMGGIFLGDFAWLFTNNPYSFHSQYGHGRWLHFLEHVPTLLGWVLTLLYIAGGVRTVRRALIPTQWSGRLFRTELLLVHGSIVVFISAQSAFWALGLFGSFGMTRVLTVLTPLFAVAALSGLAWLSQLTPEPTGRRWSMVGTIAALIFMLFSRDHGFVNDGGGLIGYHSNLHWRRDFQQLTDLQLADKATKWLRGHDSHWAWHPLAFEHTYYAVALNIDLFDPTIRPSLTRNWSPYLDGIPSGTYVFWDGWFCPVEAHIPLDMLEKDSRFKKLWQDSIPMYPDMPNYIHYKAAIFEKTRL